MALINYVLETSSSYINNKGGSGKAVAAPAGRAELLSLRRVLLESRDIYTPLNVENQLQAAQEEV